MLQTSIAAICALSYIRARILESHYSAGVGRAVQAMLNKLAPVCSLPETKLTLCWLLTSGLVEVNGAVRVVENDSINNLFVLFANKSDPYRSPSFSPSFNTSMFFLSSRREVLAEYPSPENKDNEKNPTSIKHSTFLNLFIFIEDILSLTGDIKNKKPYYLVVDKLSEDTIRRAIAETRAAHFQHGIRTTLGRYFLDVLKRLATDQGITFFGSRRHELKTREMTQQGNLFSAKTRVLEKTKK